MKKALIILRGVRKGGFRGLNTPLELRQNGKNKNFSRNCADYYFLELTHTKVEDIFFLLTKTTFFAPQNTEKTFTIIGLYF